MHKKPRAKTKGPPVPPETIEAPAKLRPTHYRDRTLSVVAGAAKGFRVVDWPIQIAMEAGRLKAPGEDRAVPRDVMMHNAAIRWLAIKDYSELLDVENGSGRDSTMLDIVSGGGNYPITQAKHDATKWLKDIDNFMSKKDKLIVRKLCEGWSLPGAVRAACGDQYKFTIAARARDALDGLIDAMGRANWRGFMRYTQPEVRKGGEIQL